ncbi:adenylosuccinate lyase [endosymbiont 'TC1' of Trimyema compressum]|uniref:adenylosuccinate lyase n=1 Tax=endosymbiont 'TC1' of Trimyema compressum TaxID=243899 RepID=UPI0007F158FF|nr:adenylosuccinate lyase [endosymbiont 'TC1' of Trimyema compressum]AMP21216.1 adenylosuccinate lyase [endosymbiont 'TC1' of Trimyema compressum]
MITRYSRPAMRKIWEDDNRFKAWLEVEILATEAFSELGDIPKEDVKKIRDNASFSIERILEIEAETRHDVVAFTRAVGETLGSERKWIHYGLTSTDVVDTAYGYLFKQANDILEQDIEKLMAVLRKQAIKYKETIMMGRTHGIQAEPTTFGLKFLLWLDEMERNLERFKLGRKGVETGKMSGAVGTFANIPPFVEEYVCEKLGISHALVSTQALSRDNHSFYMATLASIATTIDKMAIEVRHLQRSEVREAEEFFSKGQKGSSAMPHKRNPIGSENMCGCARVIRGYMVTAYENVALWHERDISHSSAERIIVPDSTMLLDYMLNRFTNILDQLMVYPENMLKNIDRTLGLTFSQQVMLALVNKGWTREKAYDTVQPLAMKAWENKIPYRPLVEDSKGIGEVLTKDEIAGCFNPKYHLKNIDAIYKRKGL